MIYLPTKKQSLSMSAFNLYTLQNVGSKKPKDSSTLTKI